MYKENQIVETLFYENAETITVYISAKEQNTKLISFEELCEIVEDAEEVEISKKLFHEWIENQYSLDEEFYFPDWVDMHPEIWKVESLDIEMVEINFYNIETILAYLNHK